MSKVQYTDGDRDDYIPITIEEFTGLDTC